MNEDGHSMHHQGSEMHGMHHGMHHQQHEQQTVPEVMVDLALPESMSESNPHQYDHLSHDDMMKMYFYFGYENVQMIIKSWRINSPLDLFWTCLVLFIVTLFHEWLRVWRDNMTTSKFHLKLKFYFKNYILPIEFYIYRVRIVNP